MVGFGDCFNVSGLYLESRSLEDMPLVLGFIYDDVQVILMGMM